jgi:hypothetical protein
MNNKEAFIRFLEGSLYQCMVGALQWVGTIELFDVMTEVMTKLIDLYNTMQSFINGIPICCYILSRKPLHQE